MRRLVILLPFAGLLVNATAQTFCSPQGNVVLFSNYDGGPLTINVDQNIPDLFIGVVSYEFCKITVTGPFAGNVTQVVYAGYNGDNDHCSVGSPLTTTVNGVPSAITSILFAPAATFPNSNGYGSMICGYTCDVSTNQGGCNTADQVAHFFLNTYGGILRSHRTQYGCWQGVQNLSAGGNCCEDPLSTGISPAMRPALALHPVPADDRLVLDAPGRYEVTDASGRVVLRSAGRTTSLDVSTLAPGAYQLRALDDGRIGRFVVQR